MARVCVLLALLLPLAAGHYNIKYPMPYNRISCKPPRCPGPCPPIWKTGSSAARNSPANPSAVWRRGETVTIEWHRNNHEGGFYRRTLVPVKHMNSKAWHKKLAFDFGCWEQGIFNCGRAKACGTDKKGKAYRNRMTVPAIFPDGDYVLGMVWYGGSHFKRRRGFFSDYYTCSYVRIRGGAALKASYTPTFTRGTTHRKVSPGKCLTSKRFVGECGGEECTRPTFESVPGEFANGKSPPEVRLSDLGGGGGARVDDDAPGGAGDDNAMRHEEVETRKGPAVPPVRGSAAHGGGNHGGNAKRNANHNANKNANRDHGRNANQNANKNAHKNANSNHGGHANWNANKNAHKRGSFSPNRNANSRWNKNRNANNRWNKNRKQHNNNRWKNRSKKNQWRNRNNGKKWSKNQGRHQGGNVPQWPTGSWGPRNSAKYNRKRHQWYTRLHFCRRHKGYPNCFRGQ